MTSPEVYAELERYYRQWLAGGMGEPLFFAIDQLLQMNPGAVSLFLEKFEKERDPSEKEVLAEIILRRIHYKPAWDFLQDEMGWDDLSGLCGPPERSDAAPKPSGALVGRMPSWLRALVGGQEFGVPLVAGAVLFAAPMLFYGLLRLKGTIDPALWHSKHGPWANSWPGVVVVVPAFALICLVPGMLILGLVLAWTNRNPWHLLRGLVLAALLCAAWVVLFVVVCWTIT